MFSSSSVAMISTSLRFLGKNKKLLVDPLSFVFQTQSNCADFSKVIVVKLKQRSQI